MATKLTPFRLTDADLRMVDEVAKHLGLTRADTIRRSVSDLHDRFGLGDAARVRFAEEVLDRHGAKALIEVEVTRTGPVTETRALVDGEDASFNASSTPTNDGLIAVSIVGSSGASIQIGRIPRGVGARLGLLAASLPGLA